MINERLSDDEIQQLLAASGNPNIVTLVNKFIAKRTRGDDRCARPLKFRSPLETNEPCFALGYIRKIRDYIEQLHQREVHTTLPYDKIKEYVNGIEKEIKRFFC
jgi:hypothetical protein